MIGPEDAEPETPERVPATDPGGNQAYAEAAGRRPHRTLVESLAGLHRVDHGTDGQRAQDRGHATDMIAPVP